MSDNGEELVRIGERITSLESYISHPGKAIENERTRKIAHDIVISADTGNPSSCVAAVSAYKNMMANVTMADRMLEELIRKRKKILKDIEENKGDEEE